MRRRRSADLDHLGENGGLNLTPLIDVVFVVLIMFILIAPMLELDRVQLARGPAKERDRTVVQEGSSLVISVRADNTILVNRELVSPDRLTSLLKTLHAQRPKLIPQLFHDRKAYFGTYQMVKNAVEVAGFEELDVILEPAGT